MHSLMLIHHPRFIGYSSYEGLWIVTPTNLDRKLTPCRPLPHMPSLQQPQE